VADYTEASQAAQDALAESTEGGCVEEYEITNRGRRVKRGSVKGQVEGALLLEGIAARRSGGGVFRLAKPRNPR
jgi:hypothetical protein